MGVIEHLPQYEQVLAKLSSILKPGGHIYLDGSSTGSRKDLSSVIIKHIYPGNHSLLVLHELLAAIARTRLQVRELFDDRHSYYLTFRQWALNWERNRKTVIEQFGETDYRRFLLYLWGFTQNMRTGDSGSSGWCSSFLSIRTLVTSAAARSSDRGAPRSAVAQRLRWKWGSRHQDGPKGEPHPGSAHLLIVMGSLQRVGRPPVRNRTVRTVLRVEPESADSVRFVAEPARLFSASSRHQSRPLPGSAMLSDVARYRWLKLSHEASAESQHDPDEQIPVHLIRPTRRQIRYPIH
jgi:Mycolic acid cyclopropane synthetase